MVGLLTRRAACLALALMPAHAAELYSLTAVNVRDKADAHDSRVVGKLWAGTRLQNSEKAGEWVRFTFDGSPAFVHSRYVGEQYLAEPVLAELVDEAGVAWLLAHNQQRSLLAIVRDHGWGAAVDGPALELEIFDCNATTVIDSLALPAPVYGGDGRPGFATPTAVTISARCT